MIFIDLDGFKPVNDRYGHGTGDVVLREVARRLRVSTRADDVVARIGGDEFVVLLPSITNEAEVEIAAARIVEALTGDYLTPEATVELGASVGWSMVPKARTADLTELVRAADEDMYRNKVSRRVGNAVASPAP